jgi:hypothetical protein
MEISTINILKPSEGNYLTQANRNENDEPIMSLQVINGDAEQWKEIAIAEGDVIVAQWRAEQEKRMQAEMNNATR